MLRVKVIGAGSIGNHLTRACRKKGWEVHMCDIDKEALRRTKEELYPSRYGKWDDEIQLHTMDKAPKGNFDIIIIGTPPDNHIGLAIESEKEKPKVIHIEKPLCTPDLKGADDLYNLSKKSKTMFLVGYHMTLQNSTEKAVSLLSKIKNPLSIEVNYQEDWSGIFNAHPWLSNPGDSYLGFTERGGGATCENSHGINIWQHFGREINSGKIESVNASLKFADEKKDGYTCDKISAMILNTENGIHGTIIQDLISNPHRISSTIKEANNSIRWIAASSPGKDCVINGDREKKFIRVGEDNYDIEMNHIGKLINGEISYEDSPIKLEYGLDTMMVVSAVIKSHNTGRKININWDKGYIQDALK